MIVRGWRVDGFGVLHDLEVDGLEPGVTVVLGPNEAGKSTLLAFLRGVLFAFPRGNTTERKYPPLKGGRHGGDVLLQDEEAGVWTVRRHLDPQELMVLRPDGTPADERHLTALFGGVDRGVFAKIFAFSTKELEGFGGLDDEEVSHKIFSGGMEGAGVTARDAMKQLDDRMATLVKQRRGEAVINDLAREIEDAEQRLREAENEALRYDDLQRCEDEAAAQAARLEDELGRLRRRKGRLEALLELRPDWDERDSLLAELAGLPRIDDPAVEAGVEGLAGELKEQTGREEDLPDLEAARREARNGLDDRLRHLGDDWSEERVRTFDASLAERDAVRGWKQRLDTAADEVKDAQGVDERAARAAADAAAAVERLAAATPAAEPPSAAELDRRDALLTSLKADVGRLGSLELQAAYAVPAASAGRSVVPAVVLGAALGLAGVVALVLGEPWTAGALWLGAAVVAIVALAMRPRSPSTAAGGGAASSAADDEGAAGRVRAQAPGGVPADIRSLLAGLRADIADRAGELGLPAAPSQADLAACESSLHAEETARQGWDRHGADLARLREAGAAAAREAEGAATALSACREALAELQAQWGEWTAKRSLVGLTPDGVLEVFVEADAAAKDLKAFEAADRGLADVSAKARHWADRARAALAAASLPAEGLDDAALRAALLKLHDQLALRAAHAKRTAEIERQVARRFGDGDEGATLREELAAGGEDVWRDELSVLERDSGALAAAQRAAIKDGADAQRERKLLEESGLLADVQAECESLRAELAAAAHRFRVLAAARTLIDDTLRAYVRARQPEVLRRASAYFNEVTAGKYPDLLQDESDLTTCVAVHVSDGARCLDALSTGTAQQLYIAMRLALAADYAERLGHPLPMIMDDCLVHFDDDRAAAMARLLCEWAEGGQCVLFTCRAETARLLQEAGASRVVELGESAAAPA